MATRFPEWIRRGWASGQDFNDTKKLLHGLRLNTVCQSAKCPNIAECWGAKTATFMIMGNVCTRDCRFCSVSHGEPGLAGHDEPNRVAEAVQRLGLRHAVITSVTRDDLKDGGAKHFADTVEAIRNLNKATTTEVLTPDFGRSRASVETVMHARPTVFGHNIETVRRLYSELRGHKASYDAGLDVLRFSAEHSAANHSKTIIKSSLMLGFGETEDEVKETLGHLLDCGCAAVYMGQYLRPAKNKYEVVEFIHPDQFEILEETAYKMGFRFAVAGPFVRSSYKAGRLLEAFSRTEAISYSREERLCCTK